MSSKIISNLRYRDAATAIEWLCQAFGFKKHYVAPGRDGVIEHAQLTYDNGMIMLSSVIDSPMAPYMKHPNEIGGCETQTIYVIVGDVAEHHRRAVAAGAEIILPLETKGYGGSGYSCRDFEGHIWSFGDYNPWA